MKVPLPAIVFVGSVMPEDLCARSPACSVAGNYAQLNLIRSLARASGRFPEVISFKPLPMAPRGRELFVPGMVAVADDHLRIRLVPFVNIPFLKQLTMGLAIFCYVMTWLWRMRSQPRYLLIYNAYVPLALSVLLATRLLGGKPVAYIADLPHNLNSRDVGIWRVVHRINLLVETHSLKHFAGLLTVTDQIATDYAPQVPSLVVEGGVNADEFGGADEPLGEREYSVTENRICLYSGFLNDINGIDQLLAAFRLIESPRYRLWIFGHGPLEQAVCEAAKQDTRIVYWGRLPRAQVLQFQRQSNILINPRPTWRRVTRYTFPSKLLEYMMSGRPVINTALIGVPVEYQQRVFVLNDETPEGLARLIQKVCSKDRSELDEFGKRAREFVMQNKTWTQQGRRIYEFLRTL